MGMDDNAVRRIMGITQEAIRSTRYRIQQNGRKLEKKLDLCKYYSKYLEISKTMLISEALPRRYFCSKLKINHNLFGSLLTYSYLCSVKGGTK